MHINYSVRRMFYNTYTYKSAKNIFNYHFIYLIYNNKLIFNLTDFYNQVKSEQ